MNKKVLVVGICLVLLTAPVAAVQLGGKGNRNLSGWKFSDISDSMYLGLNKGETKKVGVGTETPERDFEVVGEAQFESVYIKDNSPKLTFDREGIVGGNLILEGKSFDILAAASHVLELGANNVKSFLIDVAGNVGIGVTMVSSGLKLDVGGKIGAEKYCDEGGLNCKTIKELSLGGGAGEAVVVSGDCGASAMITAERGNVSSNSTWSFGNGKSTYGTPMGCNGTVTKIAAECSNRIGNSLEVYVYKNKVKTSCKVKLPNIKGKAVISDCAVSFDGSDSLNIGSGIESGTWSDCVGSFWVKYD